MIWVADINAVEIPDVVLRTPSVDVVAFIDLQDCSAFAVAAHGNDLCLGEHLGAGVEPEGTSQDGEVVRVVNVEHLIGV